MSLEMSLFSIEKPSKILLGRFNEVGELLKYYPSFLVVSSDGLFDGKETYDDLLPFCEVRTLKVPRWDKDAFKAEHNIPEDWTMTRIKHSGGEIETAYASDDFKGTMAIGCTKEEYDSYNRLEDEMCFIVRCEELAFWRNRYELQKHIREVYEEYAQKEIINGGWHILNDDMVRKLNAIDNEFAEQKIGLYDSVEDLHCGLFYHEV